jgi:O-acetyl-ADP-ribose deacetylase (regulator of RNase III)
MPFHIIRDNITRVHADAIVNTANPEPVYAGGTDSAIYHAAGRDRLLAERKKIGRINPGQAAFTPAFALHAKYIIHTVGPVWQGGDRGEFELLASCYRNALGIARRLGCESIAFPLISTGVYGFPKDRALEIALREISVFLEKSEMDVTLVVFDRKSFDLSAGLAADIRQYINENYVTEQTAEEYAIDDQYLGQSLNQTLRPAARRELQRRSARHSRLESPSRKSDAKDSSPQGEKPDYLLREEGAAYEPDQSVSSAPARPRPQRSLQDVMSQVGESFQECLLRLIDQRGLTDAQVYKRANIDRKLFSKIRCNPHYIPRRKTIISLAVALELNIDEMTDLLLKAGIALSPGSKFDLIIRYCVENQIYDSLTINAILFDYDQPLLGA